MRVSAESCQNFERSSHLEWLETNGTGTFAMGTVSGANTRKYHGYLVADAAPPSGRKVWLAKVDEELNGVPLGTNQFPGRVWPEGYRQLVEFALDPSPRWTWQVGGVRLSKALYLVPGRNIAVVEYAASARCRVTARPLVAGRDYHSLGGGEPSGCRLEAVGGEWCGVGERWRDFEYLVEYERGFDFREDLWTPGVVVFDLEPGKPAALVATVEPEVTVDLARWRAARAERGHNPARDFDAVRPDGRPTLMAGYPWFTDWGRDTMIALPGLVTGQGEREKARAIIEAFLGHQQRGLIPNRFPDVGERPEYNSVDATLWLIAAVQDLGADDLKPACAEIVEWLRRGTSYGIGVDPEDGLLRAGDEGTNLTWMDARLNGRPVTPRAGKPVEINALWLNALAYLGDPAVEAVAAIFQQKFWNGRYLDDLVGDSSLRPNQIFALSLAYSPLTAEQAEAVLQVIEAKLLTDCGLRSLSPDDPRYCGRYEGDVPRRDAAYHQGTVWGWLLGPYLAACWRRRPERRDEVARRVRRWREETERWCLGQVAEIYDGDAPHQPRGAPAQAWSLAELLRIERLIAR